jgi:hypothetical protein
VDLSRQCVTLLTEELSWLKGRDLELVMGEAVCNWLGWPLRARAAKLKRQLKGKVTAAREALACRAEANVSDYSVVEGRALWTRQIGSKATCKMTAFAAGDICQGPGDRTMPVHLLIPSAADG